ncbi:GrpB family protein [Anaeromicropila herbilytica]|uniref:GrpB family protein n=1 Tax=Anaeromicropila herbilytica TaxID=2785025 RepID=A0A7R7IGA6_9FIRM|nr:GrpB family protein [Anaeromicropila herbilytica]BCN32903.1 hypothetical protein bsdtb5_41980 [Anaeromicropila herbilytica]
MPRKMLVVPYDNSWDEMYEKEKVLLSSILGNLIIDIQHFGSTAVKGLSAKPIIDIMIVVNDIMQIDVFNSILKQYGYNARGENGIVGRRYFVKLNQDNIDVHTHHLHIYQKGNSHISDELMFRDYLRINNEALKEYERIKKDASVKFRYSPSEYVEAKTDCVTHIMVKAKDYFGRIS